MGHGCGSFGVTSWGAVWGCLGWRSACLSVSEASVPYGPEVRNRDSRKGSLKVEEYGLDGLVASAEAVLPGLGPLVAGLAGLAVDAGRAVTLAAMELLAAGPRGRALLCGVVQLALDRQAAAEVRVPAVTGADEVARARAERGHARTVVTTLGEVVVRRIAYRSGVKGAGSLFLRDAVLNLPPLGYSWPLQQLVVMFARDGAYELA